MWKQNIVYFYYWLLIIDIIDKFHNENENIFINSLVSVYARFVSFYNFSKIK